MTRHLAVVLGLLCATSAAAQTLSLSAGGWNYRVAGEVTRAGQTQDLDDDLDVQGRRRSFLAAELRPGEYGPGWLPDLVLRRTRIDAAGQRTVSGSVSVGPVPIGEESGTAFVDADLEDRELTLRYPYRIRSLEAVAGISVKQLRGPVTARPAPNSSTSCTRSSTPACAGRPCRACAWGWRAAGSAPRATVPMKCAWKWRRPCWPAWVWSPAGSRNAMTCRAETASTTRA
jgi:hypothetical protein